MKGEFDLHAKIAKENEILRYEVASLKSGQAESVEKGVRYLFRHDHFFTEEESVKMAIEHVGGER
jgi:hypothetical protein